MLLNLIGPKGARFHVFMEHSPNLPKDLIVEDASCITSGELARIVELNTNNWRKVFNITAKLMLELEPSQHDSWQSLRDDNLFQSHSNVCCHLSATPNDVESIAEDQIGIIAGKTLAANLGYFGQSTEVSVGVFKTATKNLWITPYFDYRQFSNAKISAFADMLNPL